MKKKIKTVIVSLLIMSVVLSTIIVPVSALTFNWKFSMSTNGRIVNGKKMMYSIS